MVETSVKNYLLPAMAGFAAQLIGIGIGRLGYPPLIPALIGNHWFTVSQADYLTAANLTGYILGSIMAARINRSVPSVFLIKSCVLTAIFTFVLCGIPFGFPIYFVLRTIAGICGGVIVVVTAPTILKFTPESVKGVIGGIIFSGVGMGVAFTGVLIPYILRNGIPLTWFFYAVFSIVLVFSFWKSWPAGSNQEYLIKKKPNGEHRQKIWSRAIILLLIAYACNAVGFVPHTVFWVDFISRGLHLGIATGTHFWILLGISAAIGPVITGYMADKIGFGKSIRISLLVKGIGVILPVLSTAAWSLALSSIFVGGLALGIASLAAGRITELVEPILQKKVWSYMTICFSITHALTAYLLSYVFSRTFSYVLIFEIGAVSLFIGSVLDFLGSLSPEIKPKLTMAHQESIKDCQVC
jgi:predicted MFS family arabinose efflux permease